METREFVVNRQQKPNIKTVRILRTVQAASEKEFIKEFFRYIGCLVHDVPIYPNSNKSNWKSGHDVDIVLATRREELGLVTRENYQIEKKHVFIVMDFSERLFDIQDGLGLYENPNDKGDSNKSMGKSDFEKLVLKSLVLNIWKVEYESNLKGLYDLVDAYVNCELFYFLQMKRTFRVVNMGEVLALGTRHYDIPDSDYISKMLDAFECFLVCTEKKDYSKNIYDIYSRVNAARKIREICNNLAAGSKLRQKAERLCRPVPFLLKCLNSLYGLDPEYSGMYYLAAYICQSDSRYCLDAFDYYQDAREKVDEKTNAFYAFGIYQLGRFAKKYQNQSQYALTYYKNATDANERCYQAKFQIACNFAETRQFDQAIECFQDVIKILTEGVNLRDIAYGQDISYENIGDWQYISLKEIQYIFKVNIWLAKICLVRTGESAIGPYIRRALSAAIAYRSGTIVKKCCDDIQWKKIDGFHKKGLPVRALFIVLREIVGDSKVNEDLKKEIEMVIEKL